MNKRSKNFLNYVSVSSFDKKQEANILIRIPEDEKEIKGALRFNYMIPVPEECIERLVIKDVEINIIALNNLFHFFFYYIRIKLNFSF